MGSTRREGGVPAYVNLSASSMLMIAMQYTSNPGTYAFIRLQENYLYSQSLIVICRSLYHSVAFSVQCGLWALNVSLVVFSVPLSAFGVSHEIQARSMEGML